MHPGLPFSKGDVSRAGAHLANRLTHVREGKRSMVVDEDNASDAHARDAVEWWRGEHLGPMLDVYEIVERLTPSLEVAGTHMTSVSFRSKRFETMIEKLTREPGKLADMGDIGGVRAVVGTQDEIDALQERVAAFVDIRRVRDWAREPRLTGYRAVHLDARSRSRKVEIQLRTYGQHTWANAVEEESRRSGINYKAGEGPEAVLDFFRRVGDLFGAIDLAESHPGLGPQLHEAYQRARPQLATPMLLDLTP